VVKYEECDYYSLLMSGHFGAGAVFQFQHGTKVMIEGLIGCWGCRARKNEDSVHGEASQFLCLVYYWRKSVTHAKFLVQMF